MILETQAWVTERVLEYCPWAKPQTSTRSEVLHPRNHFSVCLSLRLSPCISLSRDWDEQQGWKCSWNWSETSERRSKYKAHATNDVLITHVHGECAARTDASLPLHGIRSLSLNFRNSLVMHLLSQWLSDSRRHNVAHYLECLLPGDWAVHTPSTGSTRH